MDQKQKVIELNGKKYTKMYGLIVEITHTANSILYMEVIEPELESEIERILNK